MWESQSRLRHSWQHRRWATSDPSHHHSLQCPTVLLLVRRDQAFLRSSCGCDVAVPCSQLGLHGGWDLGAFRNREGDQIPLQKAGRTDFRIQYRLQYECISNMLSVLQLACGLAPHSLCGASTSSAEKLCLGCQVHWPNL